MGVENSGIGRVDPQFAPVKKYKLDDSGPLDCGLEGSRGRPDICVNNILRFPDSHQPKLCEDCPSNPQNPIGAETDLLFGEAEEDIPPEVFSLYFPLEERGIEDFRKRRKKLYLNENQQLRAFIKYLSRLPKPYRQKATERAMGKIKKTGSLNLDRLNSAIDFKSRNINAS